MNSQWKILLLIFSISIPNFVLSKTFTNKFIQFELPPRWECGLEGREWVCQSMDKSKKHEAIIVLAAKIKGKQDSLDQYKSYLKRQKTFTLPGGKSNQSDPKYVKYIKIKGHPWVDSLHLASEIPGFYTRYLATVKESIGVLLTFSVAKNKYKKYQGQIDSLIGSLKVYKPKGGINLKPKNTDLTQVNIPENFGQESSIIPPRNTEGPNFTKDVGGDDTAFLILVLLGVVAYIIYRRKKS